MYPSAHHQPADPPRARRREPVRADPRPLARWIPLGLVALIAAATPVRAPRLDPALPAIVFVSRQPIPDDPAAVPGLGPHYRAIATGGRLLIREPDGRVRELLAPGRLYDVSDPAVSPDARRIAFSGTPHPDSAWRLYLVSVQGGAPRTVTRGDSPAAPALHENAARYDDLDPCWLDDSRLCFASTRYPQRAQYADVAVTNLYEIRLPGASPEPPGAAETPRRLTSERNGAEEPTLDPATGRIVFARWWFNRYRPSVDGITTDPSRSIAPDSVNLWQAAEILPDGSDLRLACGHLMTRRGTMAYQPAVLADGSIAGVYAGNLGLSPRPGGLGVQRFPDRFGDDLRLAGAVIADAEGDVYSGARGLAAPAACSPAGLPDGRILFSYSPGARGDFGIYVARANGSGLARVVDLTGSLELDAAPIVPRRSPPIRVDPGARRSLADRPPLELDRVVAERGTFRYQCLNAFGQAPVDAPLPDAPAIAAGARIRFYATLARPGVEGGDTAVLVRESRVAPNGSIDESGLPADVPMFEQLVDRAGRVLASAHGAAHVAGLNAGRPGGTSRCIGCHTGHTTMLRNGAPEAPEWFNLSPSAVVTVSSLAPGAHGGALVDRRTVGPPDSVAWLAAGRDDARATLRWRIPVEIREVILHGVRPEPRSRTDLVVRRCEVRLMRAGVAVGLAVVDRPLRGRSRIAFDVVTADQVEVRIIRCSGRVGGRPVAALAEIEIVGRLALD